MPHVFSDYLIFADETGDHGLVSIDPEFPVFALIFCIVKKQDYVQKIVPAIQQLKIDIWGHDQIILHEHDIRKEKGAFGLLRTDKELRERFMEQLSNIITNSPVSIVASVIRKDQLCMKYTQPYNPYEIAMLFCMERILGKLHGYRQAGRKTHVLVESRGTKEDRDLELEFRRICDNKSNWGWKRPDFSTIPFELLFVDKKSNSSGLQLADLVARPIALRFLRPEQTNRAYDILAQTKAQIGCLRVKCFP